MADDDYYVYLLVDVDPVGATPEEIFYVGKGRNGRALHHVLEYVKAVESHEPDAATSALAASGDAGNEVANPMALEHAKVQRIEAIVAAGRQIRVDLLRNQLSSTSAYAIESASIDVLGPQNLTNLVAGHHHFRAPASAVSRMLEAKDVTIDVPALQVTVVGLWGGRSIAGLVDATDESVIWDNARQSWAIGDSRRTRIDDAAKAGEPIVLVAVAKGPQSLWGGIILGAWEIVGSRPGQPRGNRTADGSVRQTPGWEFVRAEQDSDRIKQLRRRWLDEPRRSTTPRQVGVVGINL